jgi:predicted aspartyl protease
VRNGGYGFLTFARGTKYGAGWQLLCWLFSLLLTGAPSVLAQESGTVELEELLPKIYLAYGSRDALAALDKAYTLQGQRTSPEDPAHPARIRQLRKGNMLRIDVQDADFSGTVSTVYDGTAAWKSTGKVVEDLNGAQADLLRTERDHEPSVLVHFQDPGYKFELLGRTNYRAAPVYSIKITHGNDDPVTVFVGEKNYQVLGISYPGRGDGTGNVTIDYSQYRPTGGTVYPFQQVQYLNDKEASELSVTSIDTKPVDDPQFRRPDKPDEVRLSKPEVLPFEYAHKEIIVKVRINDSEPLDFLFDTAASQSVIDRATAAENFLDKGANYTINAANGAISGQVSTIKKVELGNVQLGDVQAIILDMMPQTSQMGKHIAGIIGTNVISKFATTIDYAKSQIVFNDQDTFTPPASAVIVPLAQKRGPLVRAYVNGRDVPFLIDTGAAFNNLPTRIAKNFLTDQTPHMTEGTGLDGRPVKLAAINIAAVKLGSQTVRNVSFTYSVEHEQDSRVETKGVVLSGTTGVLGNPFWQNFSMTLDYKFDRLLLQPNTVLTSRQEIDQSIATGDSKMTVYRDFRAAEAAYSKALNKVQAVGDARMQARVWGRLGNLHRVMAKDLSRPEQARIAYEYFSKAQDQAHRLQDRETEGRVLADWSLLYLDNGQIQAAQQALQGATLYAPQDPQVSVNFAVYLYKMQMYGDMQKYIEKALFLDPSNWQALWYKLKLADMFSDAEQQKSTLHEILKYYPWSKVAQGKLVELTGTTEVQPPSITPTPAAGSQRLQNPPARP